MTSAGRGTHGVGSGLELESGLEYLARVGFHLFQELLSAHQALNPGGILCSSALIHEDRPTVARATRARASTTDRTASRHPGRTVER